MVSVKFVTVPRRRRRHCHRRHHHQLSVFVDTTRGTKVSGQCPNSSCRLVWDYFFYWTHTLFVVIDFRCLESCIYDVISGPIGD